MLARPATPVQANLGRPRCLRRTRPTRTQAAATGYFGKYSAITDPVEYVEQVKETVEEEGIAYPDEARVLVEHLGYQILDIRSDYERSDRGRVSFAKHVPLFSLTSRWDSEAQAKVNKQDPNPKFLQQVKALFPNPEEDKIVIMCSDGRQRSIQVLMMLDEEGYINLAGLKGGFNMWDATFDPKVRRRNVGLAKEVYTHDADSCGIHASGAGFQMVDKIESVDRKDYVDWEDWEEAVAKASA
eukprot:jgi/Pico_ML_1/52344/g3060.t1